MSYEPIKGIIAAPFTPMDNNGEIKPTVISDYAGKLKKEGLSGVFRKERLLPKSGSNFSKMILK